MSDVLTAVWVLCVIGFVCALLLVIASKYMKVPVDEKFPKIRECLPGANCGGCGYPGCDGYASALASGEETKVNKCVAGGDGVINALAGALGVKAEAMEKQVAFVKCGGDCAATGKKTDYVGMQSCSAAKLLFGGDGKCAFGCAGLGDCVEVCPQDAIVVVDGLARVIFEKCIGCGLCVKTCPSHIIELVPASHEAVVRCSNHEKGAAVRKECSAGCIGCGLCQKNCPSDAITVENNLAHVDQSKCTGCGKCKTVCPVKCIV